MAFPVPATADSNPIFHTEKKKSTRDRETETYGPQKTGVLTKHAKWEKNLREIHFSAATIQYKTVYVDTALWLQPQS